MKTSEPIRHSAFPGDNQPYGSSEPEREWFFEEILNGIDIGIIIVNSREKTLEFCNATSLNILQLSANQLSYKTLENYLFAENTVRPKPVMPAYSESSQVVQHGQRMLGFSTYPVSDCHLCIFIRDITEKIRLESIAQAVNTMDNIGLVFSGIRHEMGNPLNSIKMTISVLKKNFDSFSRETVFNYIDRIVAEVKRMEFMLKSLKNFSMYEKFDIKPVNFGAYLNSFLDLVSRDFKEKKITLSIASVPNRTSVFIDSRAMNQALLNILANAADALNGRPSPQIRILPKLGDDYIGLEIADNGCGMSPEQQKNLFQPFYTNKAHGNGLGLVITQKLLARMNVSIAVQSSEDVGTTVRLLIPLVKTTAGEKIENQPQTQDGREA
ncbi:MAG: HAMP domain-containing histidine kinase [Deltaproteobacteria bacterium]|nr:HAMP domain-containing histidine kinase [Deltaproteobacteria bacterium]